MGDVACAGRSRRFPVGDLATEGWAGSPTGDRASHPVAGTESCVWAGDRPGRSVDLSACNAQAGRNPVGRNPQAAGVNGTSPEIPDTVDADPYATAGKAAAVARQGESRRAPIPRPAGHAGTGSARNPREPAIGPVTFAGGVTGKVIPSPTWGWRVSDRPIVSGKGG